MSWRYSSSRPRMRLEPARAASAPPQTPIASHRYARQKSANDATGVLVAMRDATTPTASHSTSEMPLPSGYSETRVQIWVPQGSPAVGREFDPSLHIAVPGNTSRQRLIQSGREKR